METANQSGSYRGRELLKKPAAILVGVALLAFLAGLIPMWLYARGQTSELREARRALLVTEIQTLLGSAAIDARRGDYEPARQATSEFFSRLQDELNRGAKSPLSSVPPEQVETILVGRDDLITLLARADPASADRLSDLYITYRSVFTFPPKPVVDPAPPAAVPKT